MLFVYIIYYVPTIESNGSRSDPKGRAIFQIMKFYEISIKSREEIIPPEKVIMAYFTNIYNVVNHTVL